MAQQVSTGTNTWSTIVTMCFENNIVRMYHLKLISDSIHTLNEAVMLTLLSFYTFWYNHRMKPLLIAHLQRVT